MIVMKENVNMRLSILDYVPIFEGSNTTQAINHSVELAQLAESLDFIDFGLLNITKYCQLLLVLQK